MEAVDVVLIAAACLFVVVFMGLFWEEPEVDDPDCRWSNNEHQRQDQKALYGAPGPGCQRICKDSHWWFNVGHKKDCYWDDYPPRSHDYAE